jgi:hypothetical protein
MAAPSVYHTNGAEAISVLGACLEDSLPSRSKPGQQATRVVRIGGVELRPSLPVGLV